MGVLFSWVVNIVFRMFSVFFCVFSKKSEQEGSDIHVGRREGGGDWMYAFKRKKNGGAYIFILAEGWGAVHGYVLTDGGTGGNLNIYVQEECREIEELCVDVWRLGYMGIDKRVFYTDILV
ncbi:TPA: hypothetical protein ACJ51Q_000545 [Streptococcus suis]|uniref:hypothetical protein n=1 Tax=Streptococcus suis TaxID=1307 RepID=UPI002A79A5EE|nr:hypothetical protein [Streptococcus suis]HEM2740487.1 hypothetical protein [Streptococcus suis]HEM5069732.1 hypothetical protein [Streptococcus suis]HEM5163387.1 hypothetical protein [Streptococcus suis]HEM5208610.1 hypothetical protein [Streptococcus suis]